MSDNNFKKATPSRERRNAIFMSPQRTEEFQQQRVQGLIDGYLNPQLSKDQQKLVGDNKNKQVNTKFDNQIQSVQGLQETAFDENMSPEVRAMAQKAMMDYNLDSYMESVNTVRGLETLSGVAQGYSDTNKSQRITDQQFQEGLGQVRQMEPSLDGVCNKFGEYLPIQRKFDESGKQSSLQKLESGEMIKVSRGKIEGYNNDTKQTTGTLSKSGFSDDPRSVGNVAQNMKRMMIDPQGLQDNNQVNKASHTGFQNHSSQLVRDMYKVSMDSFSKINPERGQKLQTPQKNQEMNI
jgi:hypothetical protein